VMRSHSEPTAAASRAQPCAPEAATDSLSHLLADPAPHSSRVGSGNRRGPAFRDLLHGAPVHARESEESALAADPEAALRGVTELRRRLDAFERAQVTRMLADGRSFAELARALGISRQAAHRRYRDLAAARSSRRPRAGRPIVTAEARQGMRLAWAETVAAGASAVGSRHLLIGILQTESDAARALRAEGVSLSHARMSARTEECAGADENESNQLEAIVRGVTRAALARGDGRVCPEQLLLAAIANADGGACRTLTALGATPDGIRARLTC
jgi:DNA-binding Lrp family transcriptional regulator